MEEKPYGLIESPGGDGKLYMFRNPCFEPEQIGSFKNYFRAEYYDWIINCVQYAVEEDRIEVNRSCSFMPDDQDIYMSEPELKYIHLYEFPDKLSDSKDAEARATILVDSGIAAKLTFSGQEGADSVYYHCSQWFRCSLYYNLLTNEVSRPQVKVYDPDENSKGRELTGEMCPIIHKSDLDNEASRILAKYYPEAVDNPQALKGEELARRLGLKIRYVDLGGSVHNRGRLYLRAQDVTVTGGGGDQMHLHVEPFTILISQYIRDDVKKREDAIIHECIHFIEHPCFYYFQKIHHEEMEFFASDGTMPVYHGDSTPIDQIERQDAQLTARVRMPRDYAKKIIAESLSRNQHVDMLTAYERAIRNLAYCCNISVDSAKIRMIELGYEKARGVLNYCNDGYAKNYSGAEDVDHRYVVSIEQLEREYDRNPNLRQLIESGAVVYVGGYLVRNRPESVRFENGRYRLTIAAQMNVAKHCIGFVVSRTGRHYAFDPDSFHKDHTKYSADVRMDEHQDLAGIMELDGAYQNMVEQPYSGFADLLIQYMKQSHMTIGNLVEDTGITENTIKNYRAGKTAPTLEYLISICVALGLSSRMSWRLLKAAHITFEPSDGEPYQSYCFILDVMAVDYSVDEVNKYLQNKHQLPLSYPQTA